MGLLDPEKGRPSTATMSSSFLGRQRLRQPLPLLCAIFLTAVLFSAFYTIHKGEDVGDINLPSFNWPSRQQDSLSGDSLAWTADDDRIGSSDWDLEGDVIEDNAEESVGSAAPTYDLSYENGFDDEDPDDDTPEYREIFSYTTRDRRYIPLFAEGAGLINPNLIPHPQKYDMWLVVARHEMSQAIHDTEEAMVCAAGFFEDVLVCEAPPAPVTVAPSIQGQCDGDLVGVNDHWGPRDMRVFHGPDAPYVVYGSQSQFTCFGVWLQDARMLLDAFSIDSALTKLFVNATELRRPGRWKAIEKNFFIFWDIDHKMYVHHDIWPQRVFAQLEIDGSVGEDLAAATAYEDQVCYAKYMPQVAPEEEWLQQATNSLAITLCKRADPNCHPTEHNTFNMHIFHVKSRYDDHLIYAPYVMLFKQTAPFAVHAISQQPLWISGREMLTPDSGSIEFSGAKAVNIPDGHTERLYVTSMSWRTHGQKYHGHIDDVLFLGFGVEDSRAGAIDVLAGDILQDLAFC